MIRVQTEAKGIAPFMNLFLGLRVPLGKQKGHNLNFGNVGFRSYRGGPIYVSSGASCSIESGKWEASTRYELYQRINEG